MQITHKRQLLNSLTLKIVSVVIGYGLWCMLSQGRTVDIWVKAPVCFYSTPESYAISAPESIDINLVAKRSDLYTLDMDNLAVHIDATTLRAGENLILVSDATLFLPERIKLVNYAPTPTSINVEIREQTQGTTA